MGHPCLLSDFECVSENYSILSFELCYKHHTYKDAQCFSRLFFPLSGLAATICLWRWQAEIHTPDTKTEWVGGTFWFRTNARGLPNSVIGGAHRSVKWLYYLSAFWRAVTLELSPLSSALTQEFYYVCRHKPELNSTFWIKSLNSGNFKDALWKSLMSKEKFWTFTSWIGYMKSQFISVCWQYPCLWK